MACAGPGAIMSAYSRPRLPPLSRTMDLGRRFGASQRLAPTGLAAPGFRSVRTASRWALCCIVLLAAGLRFYALDHQSLWTDEIFSLMTTDPALTLHQFWDLVLADTHPPIYYLVLRLSSAAFGQSEIAARM